MSWSGDYRPGQPYGICDRCGWKFRLDELRLEWTELKVCKSCWDPRPVHLSAPSIDSNEGAAIPGSRPEQLEQADDEDLAFQYRDGSSMIFPQYGDDGDVLLIDEDDTPLLDEDDTPLTDDT